MFPNFLASSNNNPPPPYSHQPQSNSENSLTTILPTSAHRVECALLILLCTDEIRRSLIATFELPEHLKNIKDVPAPTEDLISFETPTPATIDRIDAHALRRSRYDREQELTSSRTQGLRNAATAHFDAWRGKVLRRVCDALSVRSDEVKLARKQYGTRLDAESKTSFDSLIDFAVNVNSSPGSKPPAPRYAGARTKLTRLEKEKRALLLECLVLLLLSLEQYPSESRILLLHVASSLELSTSDLNHYESQIAHGLLEAASHMSAESSVQARAASESASSKWKIGLATVAGAALIGVTGGLAAPLLAAGLGTVFGGLGLGAVSGLLGALAGNSLLIGGLFGAYGGKMTGRMVERYEKEVEDFKFLPTRQSTSGISVQQQHVDVTSQQRGPTPAASPGKHKLRVAIGISGSLNTSSDILTPWHVLNSDTLELFALRWEVAALTRLGISLASVVSSYAWQYAKWEIARRTIFGALAAGLWPVGLLKMARVIDNPFSVARVRADKAGKVLADALISKCQGERPVTLIGFSVGARVIYSCLLELAERKAFGLVENVVLLGAPVPSNSEPWTRIRSVVCGRVVNVFSTEDYILGFLYRASSAQFDVAGLQKVENVNGVENFDASKLVSGHTRYRYMVGQLLQLTGFEDVSKDDVEKEIAVLRALDDEEAESRISGTVEPDVEAAEIEDRIRARVGSPANAGITMVDIDRSEERRRQELLHAALVAGNEQPPAYERFSSSPGGQRQTLGQSSDNKQPHSRPTPSNTASEPVIPTTSLPFQAPPTRRPGQDLTTFRPRPTTSKTAPEPASLPSAIQSLKLTPKVEADDKDFLDQNEEAEEEGGEMMDLAPEAIISDDEAEVIETVVVKGKGKRRMVLEDR
ncbi:DUF726-domain-containing protein [Venturia nashicola]|uniref:DUF726-domain-containing protein n=1 Tax=Venturia nashicola TaxID=86259 RepID=A0A4Z1P030_9PEZI|nr:DUF726-domain-containing protein [Venturia nashicola]TLD25819.1 DUF726-domain-containing protein [Venturia nashicola]